MNHLIANGDDFVGDAYFIEVRTEETFMTLGKTLEALHRKGLDFLYGVFWGNIFTLVYHLLTQNFVGVTLHVRIFVVLEGVIKGEVWMFVSEHYAISKEQSFVIEVAH